jgi:RimJ/RimL family protein N-acetyltransferase
LSIDALAHAHRCSTRALVSRLERFFSSPIPFCVDLPAKPSWELQRVAAPGYAPAMQLAEFIAQHVLALEQDEVRHNLILGVLARAAKAPNPELLTWTLGDAGACAIKTPNRPIVLGELTREQCRALADTTRHLDYTGVVGLDSMPIWFVERAAELGHTFREPIPQRIHALRRPPAYPGVSGSAREVTAADGPLFADWVTAFAQEAIPDDPITPRADLEKAADDGRHLFWVVDDAPVSLAGVMRRLSNAAAIGTVYTPPALRGRGFAGSVTAAMAERLFAEGKTAVCLYTDLRNPASNRCYAKIGFEPVCDSWHYLRTGAQAQ